jgi:hypothetical protein
MALPYDAERVGQQRKQCAHDKENHARHHRHVITGHVCRGRFANDGRFLRWPLPNLGRWEAYGKQ